MAEKKIIAVMGTTDAQGDGLARAILNDPDSAFPMRAMTRDVNSEKAQALAALGAAPMIWATCSSSTATSTRRLWQCAM